MFSHYCLLCAFLPLLKLATAHIFSITETTYSIKIDSGYEVRPVTLVNAQGSLNDSMPDLRKEDLLNIALNVYSTFILENCVIIRFFTYMIPRRKGAVHYSCTNYNTISIKKKCVLC